MSWSPLTLVLDCECGRSQHLLFSVFLEKALPGGATTAPSRWVRLESMLLDCAAESIMPCYAVFLVDALALEDPTVECDVRGALGSIDATSDPPLWAWVRASGYRGQLGNLQTGQENLVANLVANLVVRLPIMMTLIPPPGAVSMPREIAFDDLMRNTWVGRQLQRASNIEKILRSSTSTSFATQEWVNGMLSFVQLPREHRLLTSPPQQSGVTVVLARRV
jgi:hypothetical protein